MAGEQIVAICVVVVVVFAVILATHGSAMAVVRSIIGLDEEGNGNGVSQGQAKQIESDFKDLSKIYNNCFDSKDINCICVKDSIIPRFPSEHKLNLRSGLVLVDGKNNSVHSSDFPGKIINCRINIDYEGVNYDSISNAYLDFSGPRVHLWSEDRASLVFWGKGLDYGYIREDIPYLYKLDDKTICFVTDSYRFDMFGFEDILKNSKVCFPEKIDARTKFSEFLKQYNFCKKNFVESCKQSFKLELTQDYLILHDNNGINLYYFDVSSDNFLVESGDSKESYCYSDGKPRSYKNGDELVFEQVGSNVCIKQNI